MEGLQRSSTTFRRSGSSGLVWEDRFAPGAGPGGGGGEMDGADKKMNMGEEEGVGRLKRSRSHGSTGTGGGYRAGLVPPALDPPSPRVSVCGFCSFFGKNHASSKRPPNSRRR
ncbi:Plant/F18B13-26 protein [Rhynchospora pubera]|uniref:Plant/F18B13-26 protein n=1 Tax=Rhynchospora pubera TaxID=906938 RepID=A0AAV8GNX3_9POAL|nr:Plant/F18B13-26 protein [Rhynchospora pubera]